MDIVPKGNKIPTTLADFEALLRDEYTIGYIPVTNSLYLLNDKFVGQSSLTSVTLTSANYLWNETADRIVLNNQDEGTYYRSYMAISTCNLLLEHVPVATEATDSERNEVMAYAKVIRAMSYYILANYYADTYVSATAGTKLSVPLITSADINAPHKQVTIQEIYDFMIKDVKEAIEQGLPEQSRTVIHPNLGAAYAFLARVYLQMANYEEALKYADMALEQNDNLYDWISYYDTHKEAITKKTVIRRYRQRQGMIMWRITISVVERVILTMLPANLIFRWNVRRVSRKEMHVFFPLETAYGKSGYLLSRFGQRIFQRGWSDHLRGISHQGRMFGTSGHR